MEVLRAITVDVAMGPDGLLELVAQDGIGTGPPEDTMTRALVLRKIAYIK